ncbi:hypothetical protein JCM19992_05390 [Thermostilla marina]
MSAGMAGSRSKPPIKKLLPSGMRIDTGDGESRGKPRRTSGFPQNPTARFRSMTSNNCFAAAMLFMGDGVER